MTKEREALKLALEALDSDNPYIQLRAAIIIRGVLAQPESPPECQTEAEKKAFAFGWFKAMEAQRLAQTKQEPVDYTGNGTAGREVDVKPTGFFFQMPEQEPAAWQWLTTAHFRKKLPKDAEPGAWNPLYNAPPHEWVGLTDEDIDYYIVHRLDVATKKNLVGLIRLCEAKLKQKNGFAEEKNT